ncbi:MAG: chemotaxis protein CheW [Pseudomonadota bacterium]
MIKNLYVQTQLIPLSEETIILPNTAVAEVISYLEPAPLSGMPEWFLGTIDWRGRTVPIISWELLNGQPRTTPTRESRIVIFNTLDKKSALPFYGIVAQGIPHLQRMSEGELSFCDENEPHDALCRRVLFREQIISIPDLLKLQSMIEPHYH